MFNIKDVIIIYIMLIRNQYSPKKIEEYIVHKELAKSINKMYFNNINNTLLHGPPGSGKYTLALSLLNSLFGSDIYNSKVLELSLKVPNNNTKTVHIRQSKYHFEILVNKYSFNDRYSLISFIQTIHDTKNIHTNGINIIVIKNMDKLSSEVLEYFKRGLEIKFNTLRIIGTCSSLCKLNKIRDSMSCFKIPYPLKNDILNLINTITSKEKIEIDNSKKMEIIESSGKNINKLMIILDNIAINPNYIFIDLIESNINDIVKLICIGKVENIIPMREKLYSLTSSNIDIKDIIKYTIKLLFQKKFSNDVNQKIITISNKFNKKMSNSYKDLIHLEACLAHLMYAVNY